MKLVISTALLVGLAGVAHADSCPPAVKAAAEKQVPGGKLDACKQEQEHGKTQFEVKLTTKTGTKIELDISPEGKILQIEEAIALTDVPAAVAKAFAAKYPKAKLDRAEKQTHADGKLFYELAFGKQEVTFAADGTFVEQE